MTHILSPNAFLFIAAGLYLAFGGIAGFATVNALLLLCLGIYRYRIDRHRLSVIVIAAAVLVLIIDQFAVLVVTVLLSLGYYYWKTRELSREPGAQRADHRLLLNLRLDESSWVLKSMSYWHAVGEIRLDLSLAIPEEKETVIILQGLLGDVDLTIPEDYGLEIDASVLVGQVGFGQTQDGGVFHRISWRSPDYDQRENRVKLQLFYFVGDIKIRTV